MPTRTFTAASIEDLQRQVGNLSLPVGSTGRFTLEARRFLGICPIPIGAALKIPWVRTWVAQKFAGDSVVVTGQGSLGGFPYCDGYINWRVPTNQPGESVPVLAIVLVLVVSGLLVAFGWAIRQITALFRIVDPNTPGGFLLWGALAVGAAIIILAPRGRRAAQ